MAAHARFSIATGLPVYFLRSSQPLAARLQRERVNGLLRQYFPKRSNLRPFSQDDFDAVAVELNGVSGRVGDAGWTVEPTQEDHDLVIDSLQNPMCRLQQEIDLGSSPGSPIARCGRTHWLRSSGSCPKALVAGMRYVLDP
jgi:hypothetical protein